MTYATLRRPLYTFSLLAALLLAVPVAQAQTADDPEWIGQHTHRNDDGDDVVFGDDLSWSDSGNWHAGEDVDGDPIHRAPGASDDISLSNPGSDIVVSGTQRVDILTLQNTSDHLVISPEATLSMNEFRLDAGYIEGGGVLEVEQQVTINPSLDQQTFDNLTLQWDGDTDCRDRHFYLIGGTTLNNAGTFANPNGDGVNCLMYLGNGTVVNNEGTMQHTGTQVHNADNPGTPPTPYPVLNNTGTLRIGTVATLNNTGILETPPDGYLQFSGGGMSNGTFRAVGDNSTIQFEPPYGPSPPYDFTGATFSGDGRIIFQDLPDPLALSGVTYDLDPATGTTRIEDSNVTFPSSMNLVSLGGTLRMSHDDDLYIDHDDDPRRVVIEHNLSLSTLDLNSVLGGSGSVTVADEFISGFYSAIEDGRAVTIEAGATGTVSVLRLLEGASMTNNGALDGGDGDGSLEMGNATSVTNNGTLKTTDIDTTGTITTMPVVENAGLLHLDTFSNDLVMRADFTNTGELRLGELDGGVPTMAVTASFANTQTGLITGSGILDLQTGDGAQFTNEGAFSPGLAPDDAAGFIEVNRPFTNRSVSFSTGEGLSVDVLGTEDRDRDRLSSIGQIALNGTLDLALGAQVPLGSYELVRSQYAGVSGTFGQVNVDAPGYAHNLHYNADNVTLEITGTPYPILTANDENLDFFDAEVGDTETFTVENVGSGTLTISGASFSGEDPSVFQVSSPSSFPVQIASGESVVFGVQVTGPETSGSVAARLDLAHDGDGDGAAVHSVAVSADQITNPNHGGGGNDYGGYYFANSTPFADGSPSQPQYDWIDLSTSGTDRIGSFSDDSYAGPFSLGFTFRFFGQDYTQYWISSNGWISFGPDPGTDEYSNEEIPINDDPNTLIAWFWDDLDPSDTDVTGRHLYTASTTVQGRNAHVLSFVRYPVNGASSDEWITAQVVLMAAGDASTNGTIKLQYKEHGVAMDLDGSTVGIENAGGSEGLQYRYDGAGGPLFGSPLAVQMGPSPSALPVELASFEAAPSSNGNVALTWQTFSEMGNDRFRIERKRESAAEWTNMGTRQSQAPGGTSAEALRYRFTDEALPFEATALTYRLVQRDLDGTETIAGETTIEIGTPQRFRLHGSFPNPFRTQTTIRYELPEERRVTVAVYDALGRRVRTLVDEEQRGRQEVTFEARELASGVYFVRLVAGDVVKTQRMVLVR